jgi:hypothetical protein
MIEGSRAEAFIDSSPTRRGDGQLHLNILRMANHIAYHVDNTGEPP